MTASDTKVVNVLWCDDKPKERERLDGPSVEERVREELASPEGPYTFRLLDEVATSPKRVREVFAAHADHIDLILMDCVWDGEHVDGIELVAELLRDRDCAVVYLTRFFPEVHPKLEAALKERPTWVYADKGFQQGQLRLAMANAMRIFERVNRSVLVNQALGVMRRHLGMGDELGREHLLKRSQTTGEGLVKIARDVRELGRELDCSEPMGRLRGMFLQTRADTRAAVPAPPRATRRARR